MAIGMRQALLALAPLSALSLAAVQPAQAQDGVIRIGITLRMIVENGLKYVPAGGRIEVGVRALSNAVRLTVSDNGPGIAAEDRARAAQPFVRLASGAAQEGSGLGLSLVAAIVRLHRGRLELQSNDPGLRVLVELPA